jgi:hypothetical protein
MYICNKCFIIFTRKDKYIQHISQIKPCKTINYKGIKEPKKLKNFVKNYIEEYTESLLVKDYKCEYCGRSYKTKSYYDKHKKETCIMHKEFEQNIIRKQLQKINTIKIDNDFMKKEIFNAIHTLPRYSIKNGKIINVECDYIEYNKQKNILNFGKEVLQHLKNKFMKLMIMEPELGIVNLVRMIHFNDEIQQNRNIFLKDEDTIYIYQKNNWLKIPRNDAIQNLIASKKDIMDDWYDGFIEKKILDQKYINKYEIFSHDLDRYINHIVFATEYNTGLYIPKLMYEKLDKMIYILLLNNKKIETKYKPNDNIYVDMSEEL